MTARRVLEQRFHRHLILPRASSSGNAKQDQRARRARVSQIRLHRGKLLLAGVSTSIKPCKSPRNDLRRARAAQPINDAGTQRRPARLGARSPRSHRYALKGLRARTHTVTKQAIIMWLRACQGNDGIENRPPIQSVTCATSAPASFGRSLKALPAFASTNSKHNDPEGGNRSCPTPPPLWPACGCQRCPTRFKPNSMMPKKARF